MQDTPPLEVEYVTLEPGTARLVLTGELDYTTVDEAAEEVDKVLADNPRVIELDLAGLRFVDSSGMAVVMNLYRGAEERGAAFRIVALTAYLRHLLRVIALDDVFELPDQTSG
ncbi:STAS domain-containing protein [Microbispora sp. NBC_01189]|uniref:STAS domain-containing protein n=1 Tax=Microbispora sp. NBC_01189 TaxID=2903583 RepID=UPI002E122548|nr:STAS domain-containing protein [Microbispora sp. NBC_01189]